MKEPYMHTIIGSTGRDSGLIILLQLYGSKFGLFQSFLFWVCQYDPPPPPLNLHIGRKTNPILI